MNRVRCRTSDRHPWPIAPQRAREAGRSDRAADRRRHAELDRGRDRIRHRAHRALADDPRGARLPRRPVRPLLPQAHRPLLFGDAERGGARLPARDHAAGRRVPDERHLPHRRQHRPPARPLQHRAGVPRRRGGRLHPGLRPPRRHRRPRAGLDAGHRRRPCSRKASRSRRSSSTTPACATRRCSPSSSATPACPRCSPPISTARCRPA